MAHIPTRMCSPLVLLPLTAGLASGIDDLVGRSPHHSHYSPVSATRVSTLPSCPAPLLDNASNTSEITPLWTITDWSTDYTVPDGGSIIFRLLNTMTGYDALCFRRGLYPEGYCMQAVTDGNEGGTEAGQGEDTTGTIFQYYDKIGLLQIYQEWDCVGDG
ncbi:hypothetical protein V8F20_001494 [Naviculisporaceae sp. PSN 640]